MRFAGEHVTGQSDIGDDHGAALSQPEVSAGVPAVTPISSHLPPQRPAAHTMLTQLGGVSAIVYSALPIIVFIPVSTAFGLVPAVIAALSIAVLVLGWRLCRQESLQPAVSGFIGVAVSAAIAWKVGESKGFFLLGIWMSLISACVFTASVLIRRPIVGYAWSWMGSSIYTAQHWRRHRRALLAFDIATLAWVVVFAARFIVQHHLYDADQTGWLGVARIAMGWPLTALAAMITYLMIRTAHRGLASQ